MMNVNFYIVKHPLKYDTEPNSRNPHVFDRYSKKKPEKTKFSVF